ncbi:MAG TPA: hypothetical protein VLM38_14205 [Blastocatellia bacterium]|nr:hypothetical protein [Blastocatellia bacterium]
MRTQEDRATELTASRLSADDQFSLVDVEAGSATGLIFHSPSGQNITGPRIR